ncbi:MAG TPA: NDP-sugar synthase [Phycisphaerae bacterium]|nr:NDP-sugar synthase [Phycisphaerae bacterium]HNU44568.1 NDP-sugar synthase [Phycisphaerae bacterium]
MQNHTSVRSEDVQAIILAGVHAWGSCALEKAAPRPLLPVATRPVIEHIVGWLCDAGITRATVCGNSDSAVLRAHLGTGEKQGIAVDYCEDVMPRGPAGCARDAALASTARTFVVVDGTLIPDVDLTRLLAVHSGSSAAATVVVTSAHSSGRVPAPTGLYVFSRAALAEVRPNGYQDIKEVLLPALHRRGVPVSTHAVAAGALVRVTDARSYLAVDAAVVSRLTHRPGTVPGFVRIGEALVASSARVDPTAQLLGPVVVGPDVQVRAGALVVGPASIGAGCIVAGQAVVSRSALWSRVSVGQGAFVDRCVLTDGASVEPELVLRETIWMARGRRHDGWVGRLLAHWRGVRPGTSRPTDRPGHDVTGRRLLG